MMIGPGRDPEMFKLMKADMDLERESRELSRAYQQAPSEKRDEIKEQIQKLVAQHFEVRQERHNLELKRLDAQLKRLRELVERRTKSREQILQRRVSELLGKEDELGF